MRRGICCLVVALCVAISLPVAAEPPAGTAPPTQNADELFRQAREAMAQDDCGKALQLLRTSHELVPGVGKVANIAICEEKLGMIASAYAHFQIVEKALGPKDDRRPAVMKYLADLPARLPYLRIDLAGGALADARVMLDGELVAASNLGTEMAVDPGKHEILVAAPGRPDRRYEVISEEGKRATLTVEPGPVPSSPVTKEPSAPVAPPSADAAKRSRVPVFVLGAVGAAGVGAGVVFLAMREGKRSEAVRIGELIDGGGASCVTTAANFDGASCKILHDATSTGDTFGSASWVGFVTGGLAVAGALTYALWPDPKKASTSRPALSLVPVLGPRAQGMALSGSF